MINYTNPLLQRVADFFYIWTNLTSMKKLIIATVLLIFNICITIGQIQEAPEKYKRIKYSYKTVSNYYVNEKGVYADTLLFQIDLPSKKYTLAKFPQDTTFTVGFIPKYNFTPEEKLKLKLRIYSYYKTRNVVFNVAKRQCFISIITSDESIIPPNILEFFGKDSFQMSKISTSTITYKDNYHYLVENKVENTLESYEKNKIEWNKDSENVGLFDYPLGNLLFKNLIFVDPKLNKHIVPTLPYANCDYGVTKVIAIPFITELTKVEYE